MLGPRYAIMERKSIIAEQQLIHKLFRRQTVVGANGDKLFRLNRG
jgi:hypothetical protein